MSGFWLGCERAWACSSFRERAPNGARAYDVRGWAEGRPDVRQRLVSPHSKFAGADMDVEAHGVCFIVRAIVVVVEDADGSELPLRRWSWRRAAGRGGGGQWQKPTPPLPESALPRPSVPRRGWRCSGAEGRGRDEHEGRKDELQEGHAGALPACLADAVTQHLI